MKDDQNKLEMEDNQNKFKMEEDKKIENERQPKEFNLQNFKMQEQQ